MKLYGSVRSTPSPGKAAAFPEAFCRHYAILVALSSLLLLAPPKSSAAVTVLSAITTNLDGTVSGTCVIPPLIVSFPASVPQIWVYVETDGVAAGDTLGVWFYRPDGVQYGGSRHTYSSAGHSCVAWSITLAGAGAASYPGNWTVHSFYNGSSTPLFSLNFTVAPVFLLDAVMTTANPLIAGKSAPANCPAAAPTPVNTFGTTASQVWVYFDFNGAQGGDTLAINFYRPDGVLYTTLGSNFSPAPGYGCAAYYITLAGANAAKYPGTWTVLTYYNQSSTPLFSLNFTVGSPPPLSVEFTEYPLTVEASNEGNPAPMRIAAGPDGAMWFTNNNSGYIGRITTAGLIAQFPIPIAGACPQGITGGAADGNLWFVAACGSSASPGGYIGRVTTAGVVTEYPVSNASSQLAEITKGPDGNLWFTDGGTNSIGRVIPPATSTGAANIVLYPMPAVDSSPAGITAGPDGKLWITKADTWNATTATPPVFTNVGPTGNTSLGTPAEITAGPDGALWMTSNQQIQRVTTTGSFSVVQALPNPQSAAVGIVTGPDGALWFTDGGANNIGRITPDGKTYNEFPVPTMSANPLWIAPGPDGALWFVEQDGNTIGRVTTPATPPLITAAGVTDGAGFSARIAGGGIASIFGTGLASATIAATTVPLPTTLGGVTVLLSGTPVPLFFVSPTQINFQVPWQLLSSSPAVLTVTTNGGPSPTLSVNLLAAAPGIFTIPTTNSATQGVIVIANTATFVAPLGAIPGVVSQPASTGDVLTIYCSGLGAVTNTPTTGAVAGSGATLSTVQGTVSVTIGGKSASVLFAGLSPGFIGLYQVNVQVPTGVASGNAVPVIITTANLNSNTAAIAVQ